MLKELLGIIFTCGIEHFVIFKAVRVRVQTFSWSLSRFNGFRFRFWSKRMYNEDSEFYSSTIVSNTPSFAVTVVNVPGETLVASIKNINNTRHKHGQARSQGRDPWDLSPRKIVILHVQKSDSIILMYCHIWRATKNSFM